MRAIGILFLFTATLFAGPFERGNASLAKGDHDDAIACYLEAQERFGFGAGQLCSLGDAYAAKGDVGRAVLSYERARLIAPRDASSRNALAETRRNALLPQSNGWREFHRNLTPDEWTWLGVVAFLLAAGGLIRRRTLSRASVRRLVIAGVLLALPVAAAIARYAKESDRAVVLGATTSLRVAPYAGAEPVGELRAGQIVDIEDGFDDFVRARSAEIVGWVARAEVERIIPDASGA